MTQDSSPNPFNPSAFRLNQALAANAGAKRLLTTVPVGRPSRQDFFRVHPDPTFTLTPAATVELKEHRETFLLTPDIANQLPGEYTTVKLVTAIDRQGNLRLWALKIPTTDGRASEWHHSAIEAAERAKTAWIRIVANMSVGAYDIFEAIGELPEPVWPSTNFTELLSIAFRGRLVEDLNHPLIRRLQGVS